MEGVCFVHKKYLQIMFPIDDGCFIDVQFKGVRFYTAAIGWTDAKTTTVWVSKSFQFNLDVL